MPYLLKPIEKKDIDTIVEWHREHVKINFPDSKYKKDLFKKIVMADFRKKGKDIAMFKMVIGDEDEMVGFLWLRKVFDPYKDRNYCDLHYIHVASEYRGKGVGSQLMEIVDVWCEKRRIKEIRLGTSMDNNTAYQLYLNHGFKVTRLIMEKHVN